MKIVTVSPENDKVNLPSVQATYILLDAKTGQLKATMSANSLTAKRTAAASALASSYLSKTNASSMLMIGTGALSANMILAHAAVRPIRDVYVWGRSLDKAQKICDALKNSNFRCHAILTIREKISEVDIISCATLSNESLVLGEHIVQGQHIDLVGAFTLEMREADDETIIKSRVYVDSLGSCHESGDIAIPLENGTLLLDDIKGDLFSLSQSKKNGREGDDEITLFKSVGHALEDLVAAKYYFNKYINE